MKKMIVSYFVRFVNLPENGNIYIYIDIKVTRIYICKRYVRDVSDNLISAKKFFISRVYFALQEKMLCLL